MAGDNHRSAWGLTRGEDSEMLALLGFFLLTMVASCALFLLFCWVLDADRTGIETGPERPVVLEFPAHPRARRSRVGFSALRLPESGGIVRLRRGPGRDQAG
jgi:hypothetical protein